MGRHKEFLKHLRERFPLIIRLSRWKFNDKFINPSEMYLGWRLPTLLNNLNLRESIEERCRNGNIILIVEKLKRRGECRGANSAGQRQPLDSYWLGSGRRYLLSKTCWPVVTSTYKTKNGQNQWRIFNIIGVSSHIWYLSYFFK